jgi:cell division protein ZapA
LKQAVQVVILGQEYTIKSDAPADEIRRVAVFVSDRIHEVMSAGKVADSLDAAVLALMNVAGAYLRLQSREGDQDMVRRLESLLRRLEAASPDPYPRQEQEVPPGTEGQQGSLYGDF